MPHPQSHWMSGHHDPSLWTGSSLLQSCIAPMSLSCNDRSHCMLRMLSIVKLYQTSKMSSGSTKTCLALGASKPNKMVNYKHFCIMFWRFWIYMALRPESFYGFPPPLWNFWISTLKETTITSFWFIPKPWFTVSLLSLLKIRSMWFSQRQHTLSIKMMMMMMIRHFKNSPHCCLDLCFMVVQYTQKMVTKSYSLCYHGQVKSVLKMGWYKTVLLFFLNFILLLSVWNLILAYSS